MSCVPSAHTTGAVYRQFEASVSGLDSEVVHVTVQPDWSSALMLVEVHPRPA